MGTRVSRAKPAGLIELPFGETELCRSKEPCITLHPDPSREGSLLSGSLARPV